MSTFYWDDLLEDLSCHRKVVPVVGLELLGVETPGGPVPFHRALVARTAERLQAEGVNGLPAGADLPEFLGEALRRTGRREMLTRALGAAHRELLATTELPEPLRLLAEITDFPLVLTTGIDGLAARALGVTDDAALVSTLSENADLTADWQPPARGATPTFVHLFGRIAAMPGCALTEEDTLEFMWSLQGERRPPRLLSRLRRSHILLLGNRFPDWLARFFLRLLRGDRLSLESETYEAVVDREVRQPCPLVAFLQRYSPQTRIYSEGTPADFVRELHRRWKARQPGETDGMQTGAIFLSYASEDRAAAEALAAALDDAKLDVWFDRSKLRGGDGYTAKIRRNIQQCDLFVPLMSRQTESRQEAFFRREWTWARERLPSIGPARPFMLPVVIDDLDPGNSSDLAHYFEAEGREVHVLRIPGGTPDKGAIGDFIRALRRVRTPRAAA